MCGIAGFSGQFDAGLPERMQSVLHHRGPDDSGTLFLPEHGIGLAHRRLSIIDLSPAGHQPMWDATGTVAIVFNGEIFNYQELRDGLLARDFAFNGHSDTEVLLNLYLAEGDAMLSRLNGMFAFALWDSRNRTLLLARDGMGVKPLYYATTPQGFLFASEIKALLTEPGVSRALNPAAVHAHLSYLWCPFPETMLQSVRKLPPGHAMTVREGRIEREWRFYDLPYDQPIANISVPDAVRQVQDALKTAVKRQMIADVPVGAFLSGGLDSSAVAAFAREHAQGGKLQCFTIAFDGPPSDWEGFANDLPYARQVAAHLGVDLHTVTVGPEMADRLETMIYHLDEPQADLAPLNVLFISELARRQGITVLLSGTGGDDIFTGYRRHQALMAEQFWAHWPQPVRTCLAQLARQLPTGHSLGRRLNKAFRDADLDADERLLRYFAWSDPADISALYSEDFRAQLAAMNHANPLRDTLQALPKETPALNRMLYLEAKHFLADHNLNYTDKMAMAAGVEVRVPLLDPNLVALAARLPVAYKQHGRTGKWIFKKAMEPYLPHSVIYRPKTGFGAPLRRWLHQGLKPRMDDLLSESSLRRRGLFDPEAVHRLQTLDATGKIDGSYTLFSLMCLELWCRQFLDQPVTAAARY